MKLTKEEKLEMKYGDPFLKSIADNDLGKEYYSLFLMSKRSTHLSEIWALIFYAITAGFLVLSFFHLPLLVSSTVFLVVATQSAVDARIERLWTLRWMDKVSECHLMGKITPKLKKEMEKEAEK